MGEQGGPWCFSSPAPGGGPEGGCAAGQSLADTGLHDGDSAGQRRGGPPGRAKKSFRQRYWQLKVGLVCIKMAKVKEIWSVHL